MLGILSPAKGAVIKDEAKAERDRGLTAGIVVHEGLNPERDQRPRERL